MSIQSPSRTWKQHGFRAVRLLLLFLVLLGGLTGCDRSQHDAGAEWQAPADSWMPLGFTPEEQVPFYVRSWRMPEGFQGFTQRWNERVRLHVEQSLEQQKNECLAALAEQMSSCPGTKRHEAAQVRFHSCWEKSRGLARRRALGDYLVYREEADLPRGLVWQDGQGEPELGSPEARKGGTMRMALQRSFPNTLRPFGPNSNNATRRYIYDDIDLQLTRLHPETGAVIPGTADRWALSPDGATVYFHIDEKARFSNGAPLTARDFVTALYVRTSEYGMEPFYGDFYLNNFCRVAIYGNHIVAVTLPSAKPSAAFYAAIPASCTSFYAEFGPDYPTRYQWRVAPTTGGYTVDPSGLIMGRQLTMKRVRNWWAANRRFTRYSCNVDRLVYSFVSETSKARELFRIGELDVFSARDADFWYEGLEIEPVHRGYIQRVHFCNIWPRNCFGFHLNGSRYPFNDEQMRLGFQQALNIQAVIDTIFRGDYTRLGSYFSGFGSYTDERIRALPYSPEKARACFARAGYTEEGRDGILHKPDGTRLQIVVSARIDPVYANCMNLLREDAAHCGLDLRFEQMDDTVFFLKVMDKQYSAAIFSWGFSPPLPNPAQFFLSRYAFSPDGTPAKGTNNITATASPELDSAILSCQMARTEEEAVEAHHRVQRLIADTASWVPGWTTSYWRFAQWRWVCWPDTDECHFCPPRYYDPMDSHLYWIDEKKQRETLKARSEGRSFPEEEIDVPLPDAS